MEAGTRAEKRLRLNSRFGRGLPVLILLGVAAAAFYGTISARQSLSGPLSIYPGDLDFGEVLETSAFRWPLRLKNDSPKMIEIDDFATSCGCTALEPNSISLAPGETGRITLQMNLNVGSSAHDSHDPFLHFSVQLRPILRDPQASVQQAYFVKGKIRKLFAALPPAIFFENEVVAGEKRQAKVLEILPFAELAGLSALCEPNVTQVSIEKKNQSYLLTVQPPSDIPTGPFLINLEIRATRLDGQFASRFVKVHGVLAQDIGCFPKEVYLGVKKVGLTVEHFIRFGSKTNRTFWVEAITPSSEHITIQPVGNPDQHVYRVIQRISTKGFATSEIRARVRSEAPGRTSIVPVTVAYCRFTLVTFACRNFKPLGQCGVDILSTP